MNDGTLTLQENLKNIISDLGQKRHPNLIVSRTWEYYDQDLDLPDEKILHIPNVETILRYSRSYK